MARRQQRPSGRTSASRDAPGSGAPCAGSAPVCRLGLRASSVLVARLPARVSASSGVVRAARTDLTVAGAAPDMAAMDSLRDGPASRFTRGASLTRCRGHLLAAHYGGAWSTRRARCAHCYNSLPLSTTGRCRRASYVSRKLYIRTFGCQMNEYDSDKMADVLHAADGLELTDRARRRRRHPVQHLLGAREGAGARVPRSRPRARAQGRESRAASSASAAASRARRARRSSSARRTSTSSSARRRCTACRS